MKYIQKKEIIKLDANENPLGCSKKVIEHIKDVKPNLYPDTFSPELKNELAKKYDISCDRIFLGGSGSDNLIRVVTMALVKPGEEIIIPEVAFPTYEVASNIVNAKKVLVPLKNHAIDLEAMVNAITDKTKLIWFSNPHNPTGTIFSKEELESVMDKIPSDVVFVMDEAYIELIGEENCANALDYKDKYPNMVILRTFSKAYGLASMRIGYGIADKKLVDLFYTILGGYDVNSYAQQCAVIAIKDEDFIKEVRELYKNEKEYIYKELTSMGIEYVKGYASFIMIHLGEKYIEIYEELKRRGILVKPGNLIGTEEWIRLSVGTSYQNRCFIENLKDILALDNK